MSDIFAHDMQCPTALLGRKQRGALIEFMEIWDNCRPEDIGRLIRMVALRSSTDMGKPWRTDDTAKVEMICTVTRVSKMVSVAHPSVDCRAQCVNLAYTECLTVPFCASNPRHEVTTYVYALFVFWVYSEG